jgi:hypothetical protein
MGAWGAIGGGALGILEAKNKQDAQYKQNKLAAATARYSPWTKLNGMAMYEQQGDPLLNAIGGGYKGAVGGFGAGQDVQKYQFDQSVRDREMEKMAADKGYVPGQKRSTEGV